MGKRQLIRPVCVMNDTQEHDKHHHGILIILNMLIHTQAIAHPVIIEYYNKIIITYSIFKVSKSSPVLLFKPSSRSP